jgi:PKD repeat protein
MFQEVARKSPRTIAGLAARVLGFVLLLLAAAQASAGSLSLAWDAVSDSRLAGYKVYYGTAARNYTASVDVANVTTATIPNLADGATYYFAVTAYDGTRVESGYSNEVSGTVPSAAPVANFTASTTSGPAPLSMNFTSTSTGSITTYAWNFGDGTTSTSQNPAKTYSTAGSYTVALTVTGPGGSNTKSVPGFITVTTAADTQAPTVPSGLTGAAASSTSVSLRWNASTDNVGVTGYQIHRCVGSTCSNFTQIATASGTSYTDNGVSGGPAGTTYNYAVKAFDAAGNVSAFSGFTSVPVPAAPDSTPPTAPSSLTASASGSSTINLNWTAATDNVGVTGYRIERCSGAGCTAFTQVATATGTTYSNTGLTASTSYSYRVRAVDAAGNLGAYSPVASAATTAAVDTTAPSAPAGLTANTTGSSSVSLSWTASTDNVGVVGYRVERCQSAGCTSFAQIAAPTTTTFGESGLAGSTSYSYRVRAVDAAGNLSAYSAVASATTAAPPVAAPTANFTATPVSGTAPLTVNFTSTSSGTIDTYAWDFGDGTTSTAANPSKVYSTAGTFTVILTVTGPGGSNTMTRGNLITVSTAPTLAAGSLSGTLSSGTGTFDLTTTGSRDWVQWPTNARKATGNGQISDYAIVSASSTGRYASDKRSLRWSDGAPIATGTSTEGVSVAGGTGRGFRITAPADTTTRTLVVYVGTANATGKLTARLSDGSAPDYVGRAGTRITKSWEGYYTLTYRAASAGQTLTVEWVVDSAKRPVSSATARLQGAALR